MKQHLYEPCQFHENEFLQMICQECQEACVACPMCIDQFHSGHSMISLKKFINSQIPKLYVTKPSLLKLNNKVQSVRQSFLQGFQGMRKRIGQEINSIQQMYSVEAEGMKKQMEVICGQGSYRMQTIAAIKQKIKENLKIPDQENLQKRFETTLNQVNSLILETTQSICQTIKSLKEYWQISFQTILNSKRKFKHYFSEHKHPSIQLESLHQKSTQIPNEKKQFQRNIAVNKYFDGKYHIAVVQPALNPFKNEVKFKIQESTNNCVWIGVCDLKKVKEKDFENCYKKSQGCYWIWQSGGEEECQFFSSQLEESVSLQTCIQVGDIISVKLDYLSGQMNKISFYKFDQNKEQQSQLIYETPIEKKKFHACIALGDQLQKVSIHF